MKRTLFAAVIFFLFSNSIFAATAVYRDNNLATQEEESLLRKRTVFLEERVKSLRKQISIMHPGDITHFVKPKTVQEAQFETFLEQSAHGPVVVTSPTFGVRRVTQDEYEDESKTITSLSTINDDLVLLHLRDKIEDYAVANKISIPNRPIIVISGALEGAVKYTDGYDTGIKRTTFDLEGAQIDVIGETGPWLTSALIITYEDNRISGSTAVSNSKLTLNRAFFSIGQLNKCPFYLTAGQIFAPFGRFSSNMVTKPTTRTLGRVKDRMVILGFSKKAFNFQAYTMAGETKGINNGGPVNTLIGHSGFNIGNNFKIGKFKIDAEASIIGNFAESAGLQKKVFVNNEVLNSRVWGFDGRVRIKYDPFTIGAEYVGAAKHFDVANLHFNNKGAKPCAFTLEGSIDFKSWGKASKFAAGYGGSRQALSLDLPKDYCFAMYNIEFLKDTLFAVEFRHDINYKFSDTATNASPITGRHKNTATAKVFVYL